MGGLAAQEIYGRGSSRRSTNDVDVIAENRSDAEEFVRRLQKYGYQTFYNNKLDKYSVFGTTKDGRYLHIDIYPGKIGEYSSNCIDFERIQEYGNIRVISPEDLIGIKLYAYIVAERGKYKHLIDIYTILYHQSSKLDLDYLFNMPLACVSEITGANKRELLRIICYDNQKLLNIFPRRERAEIRKRCEEIIAYYDEKSR